MRTQKSITVLSLFDGISCARLALDKANISVKTYYSSEIAKAPLKVQSYNYSADTTFVQLGDCTKINPSELKDCDLVIFGSPCTNLSSINPKDRRGLEGSESSLFFDAINVIKGIIKDQPPNKKLYFLMENVASMTNINRDKITSELSQIFEGVQIIKIDSELVSAGHRRRYYWSNIPKIKQPERIDIKLRDILVNGYTDRLKANVLLSNSVTLTNGIQRHYAMNIANIVFKDKSFSDLNVVDKLKLYPSIIENSGYKGKAGSAKDEYSFANNCYRNLSVLESEKIMCINPGHVSNVIDVSKTEKLKCIGLSFTVDVVAGILEGLKDVLQTN